MAGCPVGCHYFGVPTRLLAIALIVGLVTACTGGSSDDPTPSPAPTTRPTASTSTSHSPSPAQTGPLTTGPNVRRGEKPPTRPAAAAARSDVGALAFAGYFLKLFDWGYATNDPNVLVPISAPGCKACAAYRNALAGVRRDHKVLTGGRLMVKALSVETVRDRSADHYIIDVTADEEAAVVGDPVSGQYRTVAPAETAHHSRILLRWFSGVWRIAEVTAA